MGFRPRRARARLPRLTVAPQLTIRPGHPLFLDLPWSEGISNWDLPNLLDLPMGISRHEVRFLSFPDGVYVVKELPTHFAHNDYAVLRALETVGAPAVQAIGIVENRDADPTSERSAALITAYEPFSFSYREMLAGPGFGARRTQLLDAFAGLLVELHIAWCFWGDCSLSNVLYRFDAEAIETIMVDAETARILVGSLTDGQRAEDLEIMVENVAGGMADIAAEAGVDLDEADIELGFDIAKRYEKLWGELGRTTKITADERYRVTERVERLNRLGFDVEEVDLVPSQDDTSEMLIKVRVGSRNFHTNRLKALTGIDALENQAKAILSDVHYFSARQGESAAAKSTLAIRWRATEFEPLLAALSTLDGVTDPIQAYCDVLNHRYQLASTLGADVSTADAYVHWLDNGRPGYPIDL